MLSVFIYILFCDVNKILLYILNMACCWYLLCMKSNLFDLPLLYKLSILMFFNLTSPDET